MRPRLCVFLRLGVVAFSLLTWAYAVAAASPFAFDMFIRPRLFPWLTEFVTWHHVYYWLAYLATIPTLASDLRNAGPRPGHTTAGQWAARMHLLLFGVVGALLVTRPYLPLLGNDGRSVVAASLALSPVLSLAIVDHLNAWRRVRDSGSPSVDQRRLLFACFSAAGFVWFVDVCAASFRPSSGIGLFGSVAGWIWSLALDATVAAVAYLVLVLVCATAMWTRSRAWIGYVGAVALLAAGICELLRRVVLPAVSLDPLWSAALSAVTGLVLAASWSGLSVRRSMTQPAAHSPIDILFWVTSRRWTAIVSLACLPVLVIPAFTLAERFDWAFVLQRLIVVGEWTLTIAVFLRIYRASAAAEWRRARLVAPPAVALCAAWAIPVAADVLAASVAEPRLEPSVIADHQAGADPAFRLALGLVERESIDMTRYRQRVLRLAVSADTGTAVPAVAFGASPAASSGRAPHVFLLVIDSLRRDYLSPYNARVRFTPAIDAFARESFVFHNAFTRYGGTWLAMPSIWTGGPVTRRWGDDRFPRMNALEALIRSEHYRLLINDFTVAMHLRPDTAVTRLDPTVESVDTDLCHLLEALTPELDQASASSDPLFTFLAPMNVHILNTHARGGTPTDPRYPGFYAPYASRLARIDGCFGAFVQDLKRRDLYDDSVIVLTSDHGDSLGEQGQWGHQHFMFPEDVRIPLLIHLPSRLQQSLTTDLSRVAFSMDLTPTLYALLGRDAQQGGPEHGLPLFVPSDAAPPSRRRDQFLLTSSYGPTYALLRNNGQHLYVSDLMTGRDYAFDLRSGPLGTPVPVDDALRRESQRGIETRAAAVAELYR